MGLNLEISLDTDINSLTGFMDDVKFKAVTLATRQALNRTVKSARSLALKEVRKRRKLKLKDAKTNVSISKAKGANIATLQASVNFSGMPLPLIFFILGQKTPTPQRVNNTRRRSKRFEIVKGQKKKKPGLFVEKAKRGRLQYQVFRRADPSDKSQGFKLQSAPSIAQFLQSKRNVLSKIENNTLAILQREFDNALGFQLQKLK